MAARGDQKPWGIPLPPCPGLSPTSSPTLLSCSTLVLQLHHLLSSFFPLHFFFWGWGGGRGRED